MLRSATPKSLRETIAAKTFFSLRQIKHLSAREVYH